VKDLDGGKLPSSQSALAEELVHVVLIGRVRLFSFQAEELRRHA
jgi:hypothetical protein